MDVCNEQQREDYKKSEIIRVTGKSGTVYSISARTGAIGWNSRSTCFGFRNAVGTMIPHEYNDHDLRMFFIDKAVAVKLVIEWNEQLFLAVAGRDGRTIP